MTDHLRCEPGEVLVTLDLAEANPEFPARIDPTRWNGWAIPAFRRPVAEAIVDYLNNTAPTDPDYRTTGEWDGDTIVLTDHTYADQDDYTPDRVAPDRDGRYGIGAWSWCWREAAPAASTDDTAHDGPGEQRDAVAEAARALYLDLFGQPDPPIDTSHTIDRTLHWLVGEIARRQIAARDCALHLMSHLRAAANGDMDEAAMDALVGRYLDHITVIPALAEPLARVALDYQRVHPAGGEATTPTGGH